VPSCYGSAGTRPGVPGPTEVGCRHPQIGQFCADFTRLYQEPDTAQIEADLAHGRDQRSSRCAASVPEGERTKRRLGFDEPGKRATGSLTQIAVIWRDRREATEFDLRCRLADALPMPGWQDQIVARPAGESGEANVHAAWRLAVAERAARAYASNQKLAALTVAGSVGTGLADRFSDLELDCYWFDPPSDLDRAGPVHVLGGDLEALWDYDHDEEEWSDDYRLGELTVTVSSFLVSTIDRLIDDVVLRTDTDPVKHMRMAALHRSRPLHGPELISAWRARAVYPDTLVAAVVERSLSADVLSSWGAREALAARGDDLAVQDLLTRAGHAVFGAVLALNGIHSPHRMIKWQSHLISELDVVPEDFAERLRLLATGVNAALREAETLLADTVQLVRACSDADISAFCEELPRRRGAVDPPSAKQRSAPP
jgi:hypothetical protein